MKIKVSERAIEARIKRALLDQNKKLKKKGEQYTIVNLETASAENIFDSFLELAKYTKCIESWEELNIQNINEPNKEYIINNNKSLTINDDGVSVIDDLVIVAMYEALNVINKGLNNSPGSFCKDNQPLFDKDQTDALVKKLSATFFKNTIFGMNVKPKPRKTSKSK